jgi:hypothetical protein
MSFETWELESVVAKKLGVARSVLAAHRKNSLEKSEWRLNHNQVEIAAAAIKKISTTLGTTPPGNPAAHNTAAAAPEVVELEVLKVYPNPRLLAAKAADGSLILVSVPRNKNFRVRMRIKARPPEEGRTTYTLEGRCPRFPGRW